MNETDYRDPGLKVYLKDINRSLLRENLKLTLEERLKQFVRFISFDSQLWEATKTASVVTGSGDGRFFPSWSPTRFDSFSPLSSRGSSMAQDARRMMSILFRNAIITHAIIVAFGLVWGFIGDHPLSAQSKLVKTTVAYREVDGLAVLVESIDRRGIASFL
ncbi:MAG: hypothetical protein M2R45_01411 [Verrucomicrobia subdivision 3 bacterium]|nr:hypothetical protein [Limisphaerales bacterium]MCS1415974.1 hypothetical protein [Limisphaerales bacterium]